MKLYVYYANMHRSEKYHVKWKKKSELQRDLTIL